LLTAHFILCYIIKNVCTQFNAVKNMVLTSIREISHVGHENDYYIKFIATAYSAY